MKTCIASLTLLTLVCGGDATFATDNLKIYNRSEYVAPETVVNFTKEAGIQVTYDVYDNDETLDSKLMTSQSSCDVVFPLNHFMAKQIQAGTLKKLDKPQLFNWKNLGPALLKILEVNDPGNRYGLPYLWGITGIGYNPMKIKTVFGDDALLDSWDILFEPEYTQKPNKCGVVILGNGPELPPTILNHLGLLHHSQKADDYKQAQTTLLRVRPYIRYFYSSKYVSGLANSEACMVVGFLGDVLQATTRAKEANNGVEMRYSTPKEGSPLRLDMVSMSVDAPDEKIGYAFMNHLLCPEVMVAISSHVRYINGDLVADPLVDAEIKIDPATYPPQEKMAELSALESMPQRIDRAHTRTWSTVKTGK